MFAPTAQEVQPVLLDDRPLVTHTVARITGLSCRAVRWNARRGHLKGFKEPGTPKLWRFLRADVHQFMLRRRRPWI